MINNKFGDDDLTKVLSTPFYIDQLFITKF